MAITLSLSNELLPKSLQIPSFSLSPPKTLNPNSTSTRFRFQINCRKKDIHPKFYDDAIVKCNGEVVMTTGGTQKEYNVEVWSGNHPFYLGNRSGVLFDDDQVEKFRKKFGELSSIMDIPVLKGEIVIPPRKKSGKGKKK